MIKGGLPVRVGLEEEGEERNENGMGTVQRKYPREGGPYLSMPLRQEYTYKNRTPVISSPLLLEVFKVKVYLGALASLIKFQLRGSRPNGVISAEADMR